MNKIYEGQMLNSVEYFIGEKVKTFNVKSDLGYTMKLYGTKDIMNESEFVIKPSDVALPNYSSIFKGFD